MDRDRRIRGTVGILVGMGLALSTVAATANPARGAQGAPATAAAAAPAAMCTAGASACPVRISFATGAYSGQASAHFAGIRSTAWFVLRARAGQTMIVIVRGAGATRGTVTDPAGRTSGQPGGRIFDAVLPASGDYRIHVTESPMGEGWSGRVDVLVVVY